MAFPTLTNTFYPSTNLRKAQARLLSAEFHCLSSKVPFINFFISYIFGTAKRFHPFVTRFALHDESLHRLAAVHLLEIDEI
jgi:hypothetical protein